MDQYLTDYLGMGWKIFPCHAILDGRCTCGKNDCGSPGKHPRTRNGVKDASSDPSVVMNWWKIWPASNIGLACGKVSDVVVIDIDSAKGGFSSIDAYEQSRMDGPLPQSLRALSGGGGRHFFFRYPKTSVTVPNRVNWLPGVDIRSDGGYVILAPGSHITGGTYSWQNWPSTPVELPNDVAVDVASGTSTASALGLNLADTNGILEGVPEGQRDDTLFRWACRLRRQHETDDDGGRAVVTTLILAAAERSGFPRDEALAKVEQAYRQNHDDAVFLGDYEALTDVGNRNRFLRLHGDDVRYVPEAGWFLWGDKGWSQVPTERIGYLAEDVSQLVRDEAESLTDRVQKRAFIKHASFSENAGSLAAIERLSRQHPAILRRLDDFDRNPIELACSNGIVDLRTGALRPFSRNDLVTKNTGVAYNPQARLPMWDKFLEVSTVGDRELMDYLQLAAGYTATGLNSEECFFIISGPPASGKSTYVDALMSALGSYATTSQSDTFMYRRGKDAPEKEIARLAGIRLTSVSEIREGDAFNEALIKQITGGDRITGRHLYKSSFEFTPQFKLWIATNHDPLSADQAMLRRIKRIQFRHTVPHAERDPRLKEKVKTVGREAILAWVVEGARRFLEAGRLVEPTSVTEAVHEYRADQDVFGMFVSESLRVEADARSYFTEIFAQWKMWCDRLGQPCGKMAPFRNKLHDRGLAMGIDESGREYYQDVALQVFAANLMTGW